MPEMREFFQVEEGPGAKLIHYMGYTYPAPDGKPYRAVEMCFCFAPCPDKPSTGTRGMVLCASELAKQYVYDLDEDELEAYTAHYYQGEPGRELALSEVSKDTPAGCYFESRERGSL